VGHVLETPVFRVDDRPGTKRRLHRRVSQEGPLGLARAGVPWLPFLIAGLIFALLLAAVASPFPQDTTVQFLERGEKSPEKRKRMVLGVYFWLLIFGLVVLIFIHYF
jgi:hypothetical protein